MVAERTPSRTALKRSWTRRESSSDHAVWLPSAINEAIGRQVWRDPGTLAWKDILKSVPNIPAMTLYTTVDQMLGVAKMVERAGFIEDPAFCMVRRESDLESSNDPRLVFTRALFVAGSKVPGDDVLVAVQNAMAERGKIVVFDWARPVPTRWVPIMTVDELCQAIAAHGDAGRS